MGVTTGHSERESCEQEKHINNTTKHRGNCIRMLTVAGNKAPMMVMTKGINEANTEKPEWSEEEVQVREEVMTDVGDSGGFTEAGLKKQIMVDRSAPVVGGKVSTAQGWVDVSKVTFAPPNPTCKQARRAGDSVKQEKGVAASKAPPGLAALFAGGPPGRGRGLPMGPKKS